MYVYISKTTLLIPTCVLNSTKNNPIYIVLADCELFKAYLYIKKLF